MDTHAVRMPARPLRDRLMIGEGRPAEADCAADALTTSANQDDEADDSAIVVVLDDTAGGGGRGDGSDDDGDDAQASQPAQPPELSDERRDKVILMMAAALAAGAALLIGGIVLAGALGWIEPACGGVLVTRTATCQGASQSWTTIRPAVTPDWSRYRLDLPVTQEQPAPLR